MSFGHPLPGGSGSSCTVNQATKQLSLNCRERFDDRLLTWTRVISPTLLILVSRVSEPHLLRGWGIFTLQAMKRETKPR
jgi:hypothetical protein